MARLSLEVVRPEWLAGLTLLPVLAFYHWRSLVNLPRRQRLLSLACRSGIVTLLVLSAAGLSRLERSRELFVVFALDESQSVGPEARRAARDFVDRALTARGANRVAFLSFAARPGSVRPRPEPAPDSAPLDDRDTDAGAAIEAAAAAVPPSYVPHVVLLSDGNETTGDAAGAALRAGVAVSTVPLKPRSEPEVQVSAVEVPPQVREGEPFWVEVVVDSNHDDEGVIEVYRDAHKVATGRHKVRKGENRLRFQQTLTQERRAAFTVKIKEFKDTLQGNNGGLGLVVSTGKPRVLLVDGEPKLAGPLRDALEEEGVEVELRPARGVPDSLADLQNFELIVLSNVPATAMNQRQMEVVRNYVQHLGGGLLTLGGDQAFGLGGYYKTVLEEILPVRSDVEHEKEKPSLGMVLVIDKSGSMNDNQKIDLAKEAARNAVELLGPKDEVGVIAFESETHWVTERMQPGSDRGRIIDNISRIEAGGGTVMYPALKEAFEALRTTAARTKHVILLTDGLAEQADFEGLAAAMAAERITVSTVAVGEDADRRLLEEIARIGRGRHYYTDDPTSVPQIFAKETMTASKSGLNERPFTAQPVRSTPVLANLNLAAAPFLLGHVRTRPKADGAEVILLTDRGEPLLAWWRYGLGMSVAFTSDAKSRWAAEWLTWPGFSKFWVQIARHAMRKSEAKGVTVKVEQRGARATVTLDSVDAAGALLNGAETELLVIDDAGLGTRRVTMAQTAPGRYAADLDTPQPGTYQIEMTQKKDGKVLYHQSRGLAVGYPDELRLRPTNEALLKSVAALTGGMYNPQPEAVFDPPERDATRATPLWPALVTAALVLFLADVALRRIDVAAHWSRLPRRPAPVEVAVPQKL
jgi:Mg-chelatase subunit ChlD